MTDESLMLQYQQGDDQAFEILYRRYSPRVFGYLRKRLTDVSKCEELLQAIFLKLHQSRRLYDPSLPFSPWLFSIVRTSLIDAARSGGLFEDSKFEPFEAEKHEHSPPPEADSKELPQGAMERLDAGKQNVLRLRYLDELTFHEIAKRLKTSEENARQRVSRAIRSLKRVVQSEGSHERKK